MICNQLSAVVISCVCFQSGGGTTGTQKGKVDGNLATRSFYCCSNKRQLVFNLHMQLSKMLGLSPDITAVELFVLGKRMMNDDVCLYIKHFYTEKYSAAATMLKHKILLADFFIYNKLCKQDRIRKLCTLLFF